MPGSRTPLRSHTMPPPKGAITPLEAREFAEKLDDAARAQQLCASELSPWFDFYAKDALLGSGSFGSVRGRRLRHTRARRRKRATSLSALMRSSCRFSLHARAAASASLWPSSCSAGAKSLPRCASDRIGCSDALPLLRCTPRSRAQLRPALLRTMPSAAQRAACFLGRRARRFVLLMATRGRGPRLFPPFVTDAASRFFSRAAVGRHAGVRHHEGPGGPPVRGWLPRRLRLHSAGRFRARDGSRGRRRAVDALQPARAAA